jgi:hypothetical protein
MPAQYSVQAYEDLLVPSTDSRAVLEHDSCN